MNKNIDEVLFSILIPVYNAEKYLEECLNSVVNQTYPKFEAILIDDGSTDKSGAICDAYADRDDRIKVYHQENIGPMIARNRAISYARGTYCLFLDADDYYNIALLEQAKQRLGDERLDMLVFNKSTVYCNKCIPNHLPIALYEEWSTGQAIAELVRTNQFGSIYTKIVKRELIVQHLSEINLEISYTEDFLQCLHFFLYTDRIGVLNRELYYYRIRKSSLIHQMFPERIEETLKVYGIVMQLMQEHGYLTEENQLHFSVMILSDYMDSQYQLNNSKLPMKEKLLCLSHFRENSLIKQILIPRHCKLLPFHNKMRAGLLVRHYDRILIWLDNCLFPIQKLLQQIQKKIGFD